MENKQYIVALEIASSRISAVAALMDNTTKDVSLLCRFEEPVKDCVRYGSVGNVEEVNNKIELLLQKIEKDRKIAPRKVAGVYVGVSSRSLHSETIVATKKISEDFPVNETMVEAVYREAEEGFHNVDVLAVIPQSFEVDGKAVSTPVGMLGSQLKAAVNVVVCKLQTCRNIQMVLDRMKVKKCGFVVTPLAVANLVLSDEERRLGCMLVDLGADTTTVSIYKKGSLMYLAVLPMGSRNITRDLAALNILEENAEKIKISYGNALDGDVPEIDIAGVRSLDVSNYITARAGEIAQNIFNQLKLSGITADQLPMGIVYVGRGMKLKGMPELLAQSSKMQVRKGFLQDAPGNEELADRVQLLAILDAASRMAGDNEMCMQMPQMQEEKNTDNEVKTSGSKEEKRKDKQEHKTKVNPIGGFFQRMRRRISDGIETTFADGDDEMEPDGK